MLSCTKPTQKSCLEYCLDNLDYCYHQNIDDPLKIEWCHKMLNACRYQCQHSSCVIKCWDIPLQERDNCINGCVINDE